MTVNYDLKSSYDQKLRVFSLEYHLSGGRMGPAPLSEPHKGLNN